MSKKNKFRHFNASVLALGLLMAITLGCGLGSSLLKKQPRFDVQETCSYLNDEGFKSDIIQKDNCGGETFIGSDGKIKEKGARNAYRITYGADKNHLRLGTNFDTRNGEADFETLKAAYLKSVEKLFQKGLGIPMPGEARQIIKESTMRGGGRYYEKLKTPKFEEVQVEFYVYVSPGTNMFNLDMKLL
jgi:hypothetical protein